jgi:hypothetical protein
MRILREFAPSDRYVYDAGYCSTKNDFAQVDTSQDASYFGTWANPFKLIVVTYCEGDVTVEIADNTAEFIACLEQIKTWNVDNGHQFLGIDPGFNVPLADQFRALGLSSFLH